MLPWRNDDLDLVDVSERRLDEGSSESCFVVMVPLAFNDPAMNTTEDVVESGWRRHSRRVQIRDGSTAYLGCALLQPRSTLLAALGSTGIVRKHLPVVNFEMDFVSSKVLIFCVFWEKLNDFRSFANASSDFESIFQTARIQKPRNSGWITEDMDKENPFHHILVSSG